MTESYHSLKDSSKDEINSKLENRQKKLFETVNFSDIREESINKELLLGKSLREKLFLKKRMQQKINTDIPSISNNSIFGNNSIISPELFNYCQNAEVNINNIEEIIGSFNSDNLKEKYIGLVLLRKLLCNPNPPIQTILKYNILSNLISLLNDSHDEFIYEAIWCLINISYGKMDEEQRIKIGGGIDNIISLLNHNLYEIIEMSLWCLDNISSDSLKLRKLLIKKKVINKLITLLSTHNNIKIISHCVSIIRCLIKLYSKKKLESIDISKLINLISKLVINFDYKNDNKIIIYDSMYILSYLSETLIKYKDLFFENGFIQRICELINIPDIENDEYMLYTILKIMGNMIMGNVNQTNKILSYNILDFLKKHILSPNKDIKKEICWIISNISADNDENKKKLIDKGFFPLLIQIYETCEKPIKIEAIFALCNFTLLNDKIYLENLINNGLLKAICDGIKGDEIKEIAVCLEGLFCLLNFGKQCSKDNYNAITYEIEKMGMLDIIENLQYNRNEFVYEKAYLLIENFFNFE